MSRGPGLPLGVLIAMGLALGLCAPARAGDNAEAQMRRLIVESSTAAYRANGRACACPYDTARDGSSCSGTSAYLGAARGVLVCFRGDVTPAMIEAWRRSHP